MVEVNLRAPSKSITLTSVALSKLPVKSLDAPLASWKVRVKSYLAATSNWGAFHTSLMPLVPADAVERTSLPAPPSTAELLTARPLGGSGSPAHPTHFMD